MNEQRQIERESSSFFIRFFFVIVGDVTHLAVYENKTLFSIASVRDTWICVAIAAQKIRHACLRRCRGALWLSRGWRRCCRRRYSYTCCCCRLSMAPFSKLFVCRHIATATSVASSISFLFDISVFVLSSFCLHNFTLNLDRLYILFLWPNMQSPLIVSHARAFKYLHASPTGNCVCVCVYWKDLGNSLVPFVYS